MFSVHKESETDDHRLHELNILSANEEMFHLLWNQVAYYRVHKLREFRLSQR